MLQNNRNRLCLVALVSVGTVLGTGCSGSKADPLNNTTTLSAMTVVDSAGASLVPVPAFTAGTLAYSLAVTTDVPTVTVNATPTHSLATVTLNGAAMAGGSLTVPIAQGPNVLTLVVTAQDGTKATVILTVTKTLDSTKTLMGLSPSAGVLSPAFDPAVHEYTVRLFTSLPSITLTPAVFTKSKVAVGTAAVVSGQPSAAFALTVGTPTVIPVTVTAEDHSTATYNVTVTESQPNTDVWVLDSTNGSPIAGTNLQVADAAGKQLQGGITVDANGRAALALPTDTKFTLFAQAPNSAQASLVNFDPSRETVAKLYCHSLEMVAFPAVAPQITELATSSDGVVWTKVAGNTITSALADAQLIKVTAIGRCGINATWTAGFGIGINVDRPAWAIFGDNFFIAPTEMVETATPVTVDGLNYYQTTAIFPMSLVNFKAGDSHYVDVVVYDVANNRTEQKVYVTPSDATASVATDKDLSTYTPSAVAAQLYTYGQSLNYFSMAGQVSYNASLFFNIGTTALNTPAIRGFEVWRATDGVNFTKIASNQFGQPVTTNNGTIGGYYFRDNDPSADLATTYSYKVRGFNANTSTATSNYTAFSPVVTAKFMAPWTVALATPAHSSVTKARRPVFTFTNSNPALFDATAADAFRFFLYVKDKVGNAVYSQAYRYNWLYTPAGATAPTPRFEKKNGSLATYIDASAEVSISADKGTISIQFPLTSNVLIPGMTYEWNVFGTSNTTAASFLKSFVAPAGQSASAFTYGSTSNQNNSATNGYFTLTLDPSAK